MSSPTINTRRFQNLPPSILAPIPVQGDTSTFIDAIITTDPSSTPLPSLSTLLSQTTPPYATTIVTISTTILPVTPSSFTNHTVNITTLPISIPIPTEKHSITLSLGAWLGIGLSLGILIIIAIVYTCLWIHKHEMERAHSPPDPEPKVEFRGREARFVAGGTATKGFEVTRREKEGGRLEAEAKQMKRVVGARKVVLVDGVGRGGNGGGEKKDGGNSRGSRRYTDSLVGGVRKDQIGITLNGEKDEEVGGTKVRSEDDDWGKERRMKSHGHGIVDLW